MSFPRVVGASFFTTILGVLIISIREHGERAFLFCFSRFGGLVGARGSCGVLSAREVVFFCLGGVLMCYDSDRLRELHEVFLNRGLSFGVRLAAFRAVNDVLGVVTVPDELETRTGAILGDVVVDGWVEDGDDSRDDDWDCFGGNLSDFG